MSTTRDRLTPTDPMEWSRAVSILDQRIATEKAAGVPLKTRKLAIAARARLFRYRPADPEQDEMEAAATAFWEACDEAAEVFGYDVLAEALADEAARVGEEETKK